MLNRIIPMGNVHALLGLKVTVSTLVKVTNSSYRYMINFFFAQCYCSFNPLSEEQHTCKRSKSTTLHIGD